MKGRLILTIMLFCSMFISSCTKVDFKGSYSFTTSGKVTLIDSQYAEATEEEKLQFEKDSITFTPYDYKIQTETGQLRILEDDGEHILMSFNRMLGDVSVFSATYDEDGNITLDEGQQSYVTIESLPKSTAEVTVSGHGKVYGDSIYFQLEYDGKYKIAFTDYTVTASKVECVANKN